MIYIGISIAIIALSWIEYTFKMSRRWQRLMVLIFTALFLVLSTIRKNAAFDYYTYKRFFEAVTAIRPGLFVVVGSDSFEFLYALLNFTVRKFTDRFEVFCFVQYVILGILQYLVLTYWADRIQEESDDKRSYLVTGYLVLWLVGIGNVFPVRQNIAVWVCMYSLRFIERKKPIRFLICIIIAALIHVTSIVFIFAYILYHTKKGFTLRVLKALFIATISIMLLPLLIRAMVPYIPGTIGVKLLINLTRDTGTDNGGNAVAIILKALANIGFILILCVLINKADNRNRFVKGTLNIYLAGSCMYAATIFMNQTVSRVATYYCQIQYAVILLFITYVADRQKNYVNRQLLYCLLLAYMLFRFIVNVFGGSGLVPFTTTPL